MVLGQLDSHTQTNETGSFPHTIHKIDSKWMKDLNVRQESIKILEENTGRNLFHLNHRNFLLHTSSKARGTKTKVNYWDFIKIKSFCTVKETVDKTKTQSTEWEKIFANNISDKGQVAKIYKELMKLNTQRTNNPIKKCTEEQNFSKNIRMANR